MLKSRTCSSIFLATLSLSSLVLSGCDLSDAANKSAKNSGIAADNSKIAAENSTQLLDMSSNAYGDGRQKGTRETRASELQLMLSAKTLEAKLVSAAAYYAGFEFQLFKGKGFREDTEERRLVMLQSAVAELMKVQKDFGHEAISGGSLLNALGDPAMLNSLAIAGAMHKVSDRQIDASTRYNFEKISMLDVLARSLSRKAKLDLDPAALAAEAGYVREVLSQSKDVEYLLQLRMNLMAGMALMTLKNSVGPQGDGVGILVNSAQLQDSIDRLMGALQTQGFIKQAGLTPVYFQEVNALMEQWPAGLDQLPAGTLEAGKSPLLPSLLKAKALVNALAGKAAPQTPAPAPKPAPTTPVTSVTEVET